MTLAKLGRDGATIQSVKVDFFSHCSVEFIVILLNAMRFSSHLNVYNFSHFIQYFVKL
jgi:hypothetical protein